MNTKNATHAARAPQALSFPPRQVFDRSPPPPSDTIYGVCAIARSLGTHYVKAAGWLEAGRIPGARRVGKRWIAQRSSLALFQVFGGVRDPEADAPALRVACAILDCFQVMPRHWSSTPDDIAVRDGEDTWRPLYKAEVKTMAIDAARSLKLAGHISLPFLEEVYALAIVEAHRRG